jgi:hypothetical protein
MDRERLYLDSVELRHAANQIQTDTGPVEKTGLALPGVSIDLPPDDPLRTHPHLVAALSEFTTNWGREAGYLGEAGRDIANGLEAASAALLDTMCRVADDTLSVIKPLR